MKNCDLETGASRIRRAMDELELAWADASADWSDEASRAFEEHHLEPLAPVVKTSLDAIRRMDHLLREAQRDCER